MPFLNCLRLLMVSSLLFMFSLKAASLNYYWIGNSGNWSELSHWATTSGGATLHTQIPTALDDVFFDGNSFTIPGQSVNFDALTILAHDINWTGVTNTPTLNSDPLNNMRIYGSLTFVSNMTMNFGGIVYFEATTTGQTITSAGNFFSNEVVFDGIGGEWTLQDAFRSDTKISLNAGMFNTNNQTVSAPLFWSLSTTARELNMGASVFYLSGAKGWWIENSGFAINCGTSVINLTGTTATFQGNTTGTDTYYDINFTGAATGTIAGAGNFHDVAFFARGLNFNSGSFHNVTFYRDGEIGANNVYNDLNFTAGYNYLLGLGFTQTINGSFNASGTCSSPITILSNAQGFASTISHSPSTINVGFVTVRDIHVTGGANFIAANSTDLGNNTGWTFIPIGVQDLYWVGNAGNWDDGNHWSHTSGGVPGGCPPNPTDNVFFDANSFSAPAQTVMINIADANCRNMDWTGVTNIPTLASLTAFYTLNIFGSLRFVAAMNLAFEGKIDFEATSSGQTITTAGKVFINQTRFNGSTGGWTLQDTFNSDSSIVLNCGTFNTNNQTVNASDFSSGDFFPRIINMGSSVFNLHGTVGWFLSGANLNVNSGTSVINLTNVTAQFWNNTEDINTYYNVNFTGPTNAVIFGSAHFHDVDFSATGYIIDSCWFHNATFNGDGLIQSNNVYDNLYFSAGHTYRLWRNKIQTINEIFEASGTCESLLTITSNLTDSSTTINYPAGIVNLSSVVLHDIHAEGPTNFIASGSIDLGNNTGWTFTGPGAHNLYWIGNSGNWNDGNHWSLTSGGPAFGCAPTPLDNVFFDANSFTANGQSVSINITTAYCRNMDWTGSLHNPILAFGSDLLILKIYGSLTFITGMTMAFGGKLEFEATTPGQTITTANKSFTNRVEFNGAGGEWTLMDRLKAYQIWLNYGTLNTNNQVVTADGFFSLSGTTRVLNMSSSVFNIGSAWSVDGPDIIINSGTSVINCTATAPGFSADPDVLHTYYDVNMTGQSIISNSCNIHNLRFIGKGTITHSCSFHTADFDGDGDLFSNNVFDTLHFSAGHAYRLWKNSTQTINGSFTATGSCGAVIAISSNIADSTATISHPPGAVDISYVVLKDVHAVGGATFSAANCLDLGNNTGWIINPAGTPDLYWIGNNGDWEDGNHWSLTSGGPPAGCTPTGFTNVFFDANSFSSPFQSVIINGLITNCRNMTWTGVTNTPTFASFSYSQLNIYGSLTLDPGMIMGLQGNISFEAISTGQTITTSGNIFLNDVIFNGPGEWILQDAFSGNDILFNNGILNTNNQPVTAHSFLSSTNNERTLNMGSSVFNLFADSAWRVENTGLTINSGTSIIFCTSSDASLRDNSVPVHTYYDVNFTGTFKNNIIGTSNFHNVSFTGKGYILQPNNFNDVFFNGDGEIDNDNIFHDLNFTGEHTYILWESSTQTINNRWLIQGTCTEYILLQTNNAGSYATVSCAADTVFGHHIHLRDIHCSGIAAFMAYNSVDLGGNAGWNFTALPPLSNVGTINGPTSICAGSTGISYQVTAVPGAINYQWNVPSGATITDGQGTNTITVDFGTVVLGSISVQACGGCGCSNTSTTLPIVVSSAATPSVSLAATPGTSICSGAMVNFIATVAGTGSATVAYDFRVNNISIQNGSLNTWSTAALVDNDEITCIITVSGSGCFTSSTVSSNLITITVLPVLTPAVSLTASPGTDICSGTAVSFIATATNTATAIITYHFKINGTTVQSSNSNSYLTTSLADADIVTCTISLSNGTGLCFNSSGLESNSLVIHATPSFTPTVTIVADPGNTVCPETPVVFTAIANATGAAAINYDFKVNGTSVQSSPSNMYSSTVLNGDIITCVISFTGAVCFTSNTALSNPIVMNVNANAGNVNVNAGADLSILPGETVQLNASGDAGTYLWSPAIGLSATNILNPIASPAVTTTYMLTITNALGCSAFDDIKIEVLDTPNTNCRVDPMIAFTPNGDGINDRWIVWQGNCSSAAGVTVFNRYGAIVFQSQHYQNDWQGTYKGKPLPDGTYYFIATYSLNNGRIITKRNNVTILR